MRLVTVVCLYLAIAFNTPSAMADNMKISPDNPLRQAAQKVIEDDGAKDQFGKSDNGEQLLDSAKSEASKKLTEMSDKANSEADLPESEKLFLENLKPE